MNRRASLAIALLVAFGAGVLSNTTWLKRKQERAILQDKIHEYVASASSDRFVDIGVVLCTVTADPNGQELLEGRPRLRVVDQTTYGGLLDRREGYLVAPTRRPVVWYCSEDQRPVILHNDDDPLGQLVYGSEGAGKSTALSQWLYFRWLEILGNYSELGLTAPTKKRLRMVRRELFSLWPEAWRRYYKAQELLVLPDGSTIQMVSTHRASADEGSPVQGYSWVGCGQDELQDQLAVRDDIESRGRAARGGRYKQCATATAKDDPNFREKRDAMLNAKTPDGRPCWLKRTLLGRRSPFVPASFWDAKAAVMSKREYQRRVEAMDLPSERATYPAFDREQNLVRIPPLGWEDVTALELAPWGPNLAALVGHDPGALFDVSLILKAYRRHPKARPFWVVVGEVTTQQTTTEQHVAELLEVARERWGLNMLSAWSSDGRPRLAPHGPRMLVRADPYGNNDAKPDRSCYTIFRNAGILIHPAAYSTGDDNTKPGRVPKNEGIELVNTLFCNARDERRLYIALDDKGVPVAPMLVKAIESSERDLTGKAEVQRKDVHDVSHWPAALRYAVWAIERPRLQVTL